MPPSPADFIHARACKLKCEKILTRPNSSRFFSLGFVMGGHSFLPVGIEKGQSISSAVLLIRVFGLLRSAQ